jgi:NADPH2:quinone reductase
MQAIWYERKGAAEEVLRHGELAAPQPGPGQVRVQVMASAVSPDDVWARGGAPGEEAMRYPFVVPHQDGAGWIDEVGYGVPRGRIGERVWLFMAQWQSPWGTAAQYSLVPQERAVKLPPGITLAEGACVGMPAITAHRVVTACGGVAGKHVLVRDGTDAVGFYAVQMARRFGAASVTALVEGEEQAARAAWAGADLVIDRPADAPELTGEGRYDCIIETDLAANAEADARLLACGGAIVCYGGRQCRNAHPPFGALQAKHAILCTTPAYTLSEGARRLAVADVSRMLEEGRLKHQIYARLPLLDTAFAHQLQEARSTVGRILVEPWAR